MPAFAGMTKKSLMAELLLELFSEEIPARMQLRAAEDLKRIVTEKLTAAQLKFTRADAFVTPRRLALVVDGVPNAPTISAKEQRGPRADAPSRAVKGFAESLGIMPTAADQLQNLKPGESIEISEGIVTADYS